MRARSIFVLVSTAIAVAATICCEAYAPAAPDADGGASVDGATDGGADATPVDAPTGDGDPPILGTYAPPCPRPAPPACAFEACERKRLYIPAVGGVEFPFGIVTDSSFVYWLTMSVGDAGDVPYDGNGTTRLMRVSRDSTGTGATVIAEGQRNATAIAIVGDWIYWGAQKATTWELRRVRRDCAASCAVDSVLDLGTNRIEVLVPLGAESIVAATQPGTIHVIDLPSVGAAATVDSTLSSAYPAIAAAGSDDFVSAALIPAIRRIPRATRASVSFTTLPDARADENAGFTTLTTDCSDLFGYRGGGHLWRISIDGGQASEVTDGGAPAPFELATDRDWVYFASPNGAGLVAMRIQDQTIKTIRTGNIHRLAVDDLGVYWGDHEPNSGGSLWMMVTR